LIGVVTPTLAAYAALSPAENRFAVIKLFLGLRKGKAESAWIAGLLGFGSRHFSMALCNGAGIGHDGPERWVPRHRTFIER
jgi:hypothetical protein